MISELQVLSYTFQRNPRIALLQLIKTAFRPLPDRSIHIEVKTRIRKNSRPQIPSGSNIVIASNEFSHILIHESSRRLAAGYLAAAISHTLSADFFCNIRSIRPN